LATIAPKGSTSFPGKEIFKFLKKIVFKKVLKEFKKQEFKKLDLKKSLKSLKNLKS
jgi:hypothetical protein